MVAVFVLTSSARDSAMKIVAVLGSPRPQGNSSTLARELVKI